MPGAELGHHADECTFDVIIRKYGLTDPALLRMAKIVNAADTDRFDADPLAAGLEAIAVGYSLRFPDDNENVTRQLEIYDALYAWCRLETARRGGLSRPRVCAPWPTSSACGAASSACSAWSCSSAWASTWPSSSCRST